MDEKTLLEIGEIKGSMKMISEQHTRLAIHNESMEVKLVGIIADMSSMKNEVKTIKEILVIQLEKGILGGLTKFVSTKYGGIILIFIGGLVLVALTGANIDQVTKFIAAVHGK